MKTTVLVPRILTSYCDDKNELTVEGDTVGEVLDQVQSLFPELYRCICNETGSLREHVNLFINNQLFDRKQFTTKLRSGDVVSVFQSVSGG